MAAPPPCPCHSWPPAAQPRSGGRGSPGGRRCRSPGPADFPPGTHHLQRAGQNMAELGLIMPSLRMSITSVEGMQNHGAKFVEMSKYLPNFKTSCNKRSRLARFLPMLRYPNAAPTTSSALNQLLGRRPQVDVAAGEMPRGGNSLHLAKGDRGTLKTKDAGIWMDLGSLSQLIRPIPELLKLEDFQDLSAVLDRMAKALGVSQLKQLKQLLFDRICIRLCKFVYQSLFIG